MHRAGPLAATALLVATAILWFAPLIPVVSAVDPASPSPSAEPAPVADPTPTPTPDPVPSVDPRPTPTADPGPTPSADPLPTPDPTPDPTPTPPADPGPTPDPAPTAAPDPTPTALPDPTPTPLPEPTPTAAPDPTPTPDPSATPAPDPTASPTPDPTPTPDPSPTPTPEPLPKGHVGPEGGTVTVGNIAVEIAAGAVSGPTRIDIIETTGPDYLGNPAVQAISIVASDDASGDVVTSFVAPSRLVAGTAGLDLNGAGLANLRLAQLVHGEWSVLDTQFAGTTVAVVIHGPGTYGIVEMPTRARVTVTQSSDAPAEGRHRIDPGSTLKLTISVVPETKLYGGTLVSVIPTGWIVLDADGGTVQAATTSITWPLATTIGGRAITRAPRFRAPTRSPTDQTSVSTAAFAARVDQLVGDPTQALDITVLVAPRVVLEHTIAAHIDTASGIPMYGPQDAVLQGQRIFDVFRLRFRLENVDTVPVSIGALHLEYRPTDPAGSAWAVVPGPASTAGDAFHAAAERRDFQVAIDVVGGPEALLAVEPNRALRAVDGFRSSGINPGPGVLLAGDSAAEVEFSISATAFATYLSGYEFRVTETGVPIGPAATSAATAVVVIGPEPVPDLTAGQRQGASGTGARYGLATAGRLATVLAATSPDGSSPHGDLSLTTDSCGACHRSHSAPARNLLTTGSPQSQLCFACHDGLGASTGPSHQWSVALPNDPATASYYQHPATAAVGHVLADSEEFKATDNRHSECADCHNPHFPTDTGLKATATASGWTISGALRGASGVGVTNLPAPASDPVYTFLRQDPSGAAQPVQYEYQLCFKCHSGYTNLAGLPNSPANDPAHPSRWALDKGAEFNPNNPGAVSYHPIEQAGTNASAAMDASLAGTSPYKLWVFTSADTVRCTQCHADSAIAPTLPAADARLDTHTSANRGILLGAYRDRQVHLAGEDYAAGDFQLCYQCHAERPFTTASKDPPLEGDTNFPLHGVHVKYFGEKGTSVNPDIDTPDAGAGNAICAECHYRIHSTANRVGAQNAYPGLVNFAPDVTGLAADSWQKTANGGSCALTCHGYVHTGGLTGNSNYLAVPEPVLPVAAPRGAPID